MNSNQKLETLRAFLKTCREYEEEKKSIGTQLKENYDQMYRIIDEKGDLLICQSILNQCRQLERHRKEMATKIKSVKDQMYALIDGVGEYDEDQMDIYDVLDEEAI